MEGQESDQSATLLDIEEDGLDLPPKEEVDEEKEDAQAKKEKESFEKDIQKLGKHANNKEDNILTLGKLLSLR